MWSLERDQEETKIVCVKKGTGNFREGCKIISWPKINQAP